jgi:hypothetical protein
MYFESDAQRPPKKRGCTTPKRRLATGVTGIFGGTSNQAPTVLQIAIDLLD